MLYSAAMDEEMSKEYPAIGVLRFLAWAQLIGSAIAAVFIWLSASDRIRPGSLTIKETDPFDIISGFVILASGLVGCAFLLVVCYIAENLILIRRHLAERPVGSPDDGDNYWRQKSS